MAKQGINKELVVQAAGKLIEQQGISRFSMGKLARQLHIKTASLYNHVESLEKLLEYVGEEAVSQLVHMENKAIEGKQGDEALYGLEEAYRFFVRDHCELYRVIMSFPKLDNPTLEQEAGEIISPVLRVLSHYGLTETLQFHWQRVLRAVMSGFALHHQSDGFSHFPVERDESFRIAIQCVADGLRKAGGDRQ